MTDRSKIVTLSASKLTTIAFASLLLAGCGGSSSSSSDTVTTARSAAQSAAIIESRPVPFDARSLEELADLIAADAETTPEDRARMIVLAEAGISNLLATLDDLARNDDPADTYGVLTELADRPWTRALVNIIAYLRHAPLDDAERTRADNLLTALQRARTSALELQKAQLAGSSTGLPATLTIDNKQ